MALTIIKAIKHPTTENIEKYYDKILEIYYFLIAEHADFKVFFYINFIYIFIKSQKKQP